MSSRAALAWLWLALATSGLCGCAALNVRHLDPEPWTVNVAKTSEMRFWRFDYTAEPMREWFGVRGTARLKYEEVPAGSAWVDDLWFAVYLSDKRGKVLAQALQVFPPRPLDDECGVPFDFVLKPETLVSGPLYISFGYRMVLTRDRLNTSQSMPFFASEGAVFR